VITVRPAEGDVEIEAFEVMLPDPEDPDTLQIHLFILIMPLRFGNISFPCTFYFFIHFNLPLRLRLSPVAIE